MSTFYSGQNGQLKLKTSADGVTPEVYTPLGKVTNWQFDQSMSPLSTTSLQDTDQTFIVGLRSMTGSATLYYYDDTSGTTTTNSAKTLIDNIIIARKNTATAGIATRDQPPLVLELCVVEGTSTKLMRIEVLLTGASMNMAVGEVLSAAISFQVNGAPLFDDL